MQTTSDYRKRDIARWARSTRIVLAKPQKVCHGVLVLDHSAFGFGPSVIADLPGLDLWQFPLQAPGVRWGGPRARQVRKTAPSKRRHVGN